MRTQIYLAVLAGVSAVVLGALGAHALKAVLQERHAVETWSTASAYHLAHAPVILFAALRALDGQSVNPWIRRATWLWFAGVVLFCGSLYALALGGPRWLGPLTPVGGLCFIAGWLSIAGAAQRPRK